MTTRLVSLTFDATDPVRLARFWASALGWEIADETGDEIGVLPTDGTRFIFVFVRVPEAKAAKNPIHPELVTESVDDQRAVVGRLLELGAYHVDIGQGPESDDGTVLADPEGNELCVGVRGEFFADTGFLGAIAFEPAHPATCYFWGQAIGWPVVYDEGGDVAIREPGGTGRSSRPALPGPRSTRRAACTSTSRRRSVTTMPRRSIDCSRSARAGSTSDRVTCPGWCWPIPTATSSAC